MFQIRKFYDDNGLEYFDGAYSHKHTRQGWVNRPCPFCTGNPGLHLGFNEKSGYFVCYRCGGHPVAKVVRALLNVSWYTANKIVKQYGGDSDYKTKVQRENREKGLEVKLPAGTKQMANMHTLYLRDRGFDPDQLYKTWGLLGTGSIGRYKYRIIAPVFFRGVLVSFQGRDITNKSSLKYKACPKHKERIHHKHVLYGFDLAGRDVIVVEGITDAWRLGPGAVATFGIKYTWAQVQLLSTFRRVFVWFDESDPEAVDKSQQLMLDLGSLGVESNAIWTGLGGDPGDKTPEEAKYIMQDLLLG